MKLLPNESLVVAYAEPASGPGWSNAPVIAILKNNDTGGMRKIYIDLYMFSDPEIKVLYPLSAHITQAMTDAVEKKLKGLYLEVL